MDVPDKEELLGETVRIRTTRIGRDVAFLVTGGEAHIGAAATAYRLADGSVRAETTALPGHREGELAAELATMAATSLETTVAVLVGIHVDRPSKPDIERIVEEARSRMRRLLDDWDEEGKERSEHAQTAR